MQVIQLVQPFDSCPVLRWNAQPVHSGVQGQMDLKGNALGGEGFPVGLVHHHLGQPPAAERGASSGGVYPKIKISPPIPA